MKKRILIPRVPLNNNMEDGELRIEDHFDLDSLTEEQLRSIHIDLREFLDSKERAKYED